MNAYPQISKVKQGQEYTQLYLDVLRVTTMIVRDVKCFNCVVYLSVNSDILVCLLQLGWITQPQIPKFKQF